MYLKISEMPKLVQTPILDDKINDISKKIKEMSSKLDEMLIDLSLLKKSENEFNFNENQS